MARDDVRAVGRDQMEQKEVQKGLTNCQVVKWLPEEGLLPENAVEEAALDARGYGTGTEWPLLLLVVAAWCH